MPRIDLNTGLLKLGANQVVFEPLSATMAALTAIGSAASASGAASGLSAIGSLVSAGGTIASGIGANNAAQYQSDQLKQAANESRASGQRQSFEHQRVTDLNLSKLQAGAAASGGGADDPTIQNLAGGIAGRGEYESLMDIYGGENRARGLEDQAGAARLNGKNALTKSYLSAGGTILSSAGSMAGKFGGANIPRSRIPGEPLDINPDQGF